MVLTRDEIEKAQKWNVESLYENWAVWEKDLEKARDFSKLSFYKGKFLNSAEELKKFLEIYFAAERLIDKLYTYAHLRQDEDLGDNNHKEALGKISSVSHDFQIETSWVEPELLHLSKEVFSAYLQNESLKPYYFYLEKIYRLKPHTLSLEEEKLLALSGKPLSASYKAFSAFNCADLNFPKIKDQEQKEHELTSGLYSIYLRSNDRILRKNAFKTLHETYLGYENTLCELLSGQTQSHLYMSRAKRYKSCLEGALFVHNIDPKVYHTLIETSRAEITSLHRYINLRKKHLKVDQLHVYDLYAPLVDDLELKYTYEEACEAVIESVALLGQSYQSALKEGLTNRRWVDPFENKRKRSGAYSSGCYDSMPYILMNYHGSLNDVLTLAHEAGHSMHSYLSRKNQSYHEAQYPIFVAEVASTFNEQLLLDYLLKKTKNPKEKAYLLNYKIEGIRTTFFRQTMFAEFELFIHECAEKNIPLTPALLKEKYLRLNQDYFGSALEIDEEIAVEWARVPHFYYFFYVYQYATGISAAYALFKKVKQSESCRQKYLDFLKSGGSQYPLDLLKTAGVDMTNPDSIRSIISEFDKMVCELDALENIEGSSIPTR